MESIRSHMQQAQKWLIGSRNGDSGWGIYEAAGSRPLNTAEALLGLKYAGTSLKLCEGSIKYMEDLTLGKFDLKAQYQRHFAWVGYTLIVFGRHGNNVALRLCLDRLVEFQNLDGGWSHRPAGPSHVTATYLGMRTLIAALHKELTNIDLRLIRERLDKAIIWLIRFQNKDNGWGFSSDEPSNLAATSFAVHALLDTYTSMSTNRVMDKNLIVASQYLKENLTNSREVLKEENVGGDFEYPFHHFTTPWLLSALIRSGYPLDDNGIWREFNYFLSLKSPSGGWSEFPLIRPTIWATYNALLLFRIIGNHYHAYDKLTNLLDEKAEIKKEYKVKTQNLEKKIQEIENELDIALKDIERIVVIGVKGFELYLSKKLYFAIIFIIGLLYLFFLSIAQTLPENIRFVSLILIPLVSFGLWFIAGKQILKWNNDKVVTMGLGIIGILLTIHIAFIGL